MLAPVKVVSLNSVHARAEKVLCAALRGEVVVVARVLTDLEKQQYLVCECACKSTAFISHELGGSHTGRW